MSRLKRYHEIKEDDNGDKYAVQRSNNAYKM